MKKFTPEERKDDELCPKFKRRTVSAVREFPIGCGPRRQIGDHGDANHASVAATVRGKFNPPIPERLQAFPVMRKFPHNPPGCGNLVSNPSGNASPSNLRMVENCKQLPNACVIHPEDYAKTLALTPLVENEEVEDADVSERCLILRVSDDEASKKMREKVVEALNLFQEIRNEFLLEKKRKTETRSGGEINQVNFLAAEALRKIEKCVNVSKQIGPVCGVEVGDRFSCRAELKVVGLHHQFICGIDHMEKDGKILATSIVDSHRYENVVKSSSVMVYSGEGGNTVFPGKQPNDQKLVKGNLALKNSFEARTPVRVIRSFHILKESIVLGTSGKKIDGKVYIYDGLWYVDGYWKGKGRLGNDVYKFKMVRIDGQPPFDFRKFVNNTKAGETMRKGNILMNDISQGKEKFAICVKNDIDDEKPPFFNYVTNIVYPASFAPCVHTCCDCMDGCENSKKCACAIKNGNAMPYDCSGRIVVDNPFVYECAPSCKCSPSCINKVSQNGVRFQLEVFKSKSGHWGVRSKNYIRCRSFVCEYINGEVLRVIESKIDLERCIFDRGKEYGNKDYQGGRNSEVLQRGNVGSFVNHSCSPNLFARYILYDHDDERIPHIMLFAMMDIPPLRELTFDHQRLDEFVMYNGEMNL
ncbi:histone-lysine N-methyltransferase, H3 lysine-9 specific SUVH5 [Ziziphus jujuba]|uniref:Histone-lysine N-methyltransferase, H3 lysine-9 specific SUVH5 n=1 Tax=Ziziphus jujuba TaxID=326968 RepID=A0A6P6G1G0_ZIZJJ|nr:histone-lysine N-methyltransferase, H3 lysine-9 specific SUVH5 [Ziziphus jujuba]